MQENDAILKIDLDGNPWQNPIDVWFPVSATEPSDDDGPGRQARVDTARVVTSVPGSR